MSQDVVAQIIDSLVGLGAAGFLLIGGGIVYWLTTKNKTQIQPTNGKNGNGDQVLIRDLLNRFDSLVKIIYDQQVELRVQRQELTNLNQSLQELVKRIDQIFLQWVK